MPTYDVTGAAIAHFVVEADDKDQAIDFAMDMMKEDFPDADSYDVSVTEVN
jgi:hypothetical protein